VGYKQILKRETLVSLCALGSEAEEVDAILIAENYLCDHLLCLLSSEPCVCFFVVATEDEYQGPTVSCVVDV
jgi:hypothetical protein